MCRMIEVKLENNNDQISCFDFGPTSLPCPSHLDLLCLALFSQHRLIYILDQSNQVCKW